VPLFLLKLYPLRSTRTKQQPKWITSGDYVTKSAVTTSIENSWKQRADYVMELLRTGILKGMEQEISTCPISCSIPFKIPVLNNSIT
jgi:hypothetical protein